MAKLQDLKYWKQGQEFLQVTIPIISGDMTWISDSSLVNAVSEAGGMGILAAGNMPVKTFEKEVKIRLIFRLRRPIWGVKWAF